MSHLLPRTILALSGLTCACIVSAQFPGSQDEEETSGGSDRFSDETLEGSWSMEFEVVFDARRAEAEAAGESNDAEEEDEAVTLRADVTVFGQQVSGRFRNPAVGEFSCTMYEGSARCEQGRMVIVWPDSNRQEVAEFAFTVDSIDRRRARGEARMFDQGMLRMYDVHMRKR